MSQRENLEAITDKLIDIFEVKSPPVPIETILQSPRNDMWDMVDVTQLSGTFRAFTDPFSPRMSLARMLARHVVNCDWGTANNLPQIVKTEDDMRAFARMLTMPLSLISNLSVAAKNPTAMAMQFEVPEEDARLRLAEVE